MGIRIDSEEIFKFGDEVFYYEGGDIYRALILENNCDQQKLEYKLRILGLEHDILGGNFHLGNGLEFVCFKLREYSKTPILWIMAAGKKRIIKRLRGYGFNI